MFTVLSVALSAAAFSGEGCLDPFTASSTWSLSTGTLTLERGVLELDGRLLAAEVESVDVRGDRVVWVEHRSDGLLRDLWSYDALSDVPMPLTLATTPSQPVLSDDASRVAYVDGRTGLTALWLQPVDGGEAIQLTNHDLVRTPGQAPEGFVPSPDAGDLAFEPGRLTWTAEGVPQSVLLPRGGAR
jgi:hypothetical protein